MNPVVLRCELIKTSKRLFSSIAVPVSKNAYTNGKIFRFLIVGPPGVGKGTFTRVIASHFKNVKIIDTGHTVRSIISNENSDKHGIDSHLISEMQKCLKEYNSFIPDKTIVPIMLQSINNIESIESHENPNENQITLLDGFPRTLSQLKLFDASFFDLIINLQCNLDLCLLKSLHRIDCKHCGKVYNTLTKQQMKSFKIDMPSQSPINNGICDDCNKKLEQRASDKQKEIARKRMRIYKDSTLPMIEYMIKLKNDNENNNQLNRGTAAALCYNIVTIDVANGVTDASQVIELIKQHVS